MKSCGSYKSIEKVQTMFPNGSSFIIYFLYIISKNLKIMIHCTSPFVNFIFVFWKIVIMSKMISFVLLKYIIMSCISILLYCKTCSVQKLFKQKVYVLNRFLQRILLRWHLIVFVGRFHFSFNFFIYLSTFQIMKHFQIKHFFVAMFTFVSFL